jgi:hypothetical protein
MLPLMYRIMHEVTLAFNGRCPYPSPKRVDQSPQESLRLAKATGHLGVAALIDSPIESLNGRLRKECLNASWFYESLS